MNKCTGFTDLCIPVAATDVLEPILREAIELGYRNIAIEQIFDASKALISNKNDAIPKPHCLKELKAAIGGQLRLLNRLTVMFSDTSVSLILNKSNNLRGYNLIAALPTNESSFQYACQTMACDLITYSSAASHLKMNRKFYYLAVDRNIAFEIKYAPAIINSNERKATIKRAHRYHSFGKSKNVIISSNALNPFQLRSPYDIVNLGLIFGLSEEQSKESIRGVPNRILLSAEGRRFGKAGVVISLRDKKAMAEDSDDYSDGELEEAISDEEKEDGSDPDVDMCKANETDEDDTELMRPPKKMAKHDKSS
ncbi:ribonuclease P protein subunit p30 [Anopheles nili]|uniref:ribonuclease P protein subunit p30 n=1 Tax=Anopheles nili TaxID=185578 RepID=UPI00237A39A8|nr:ribonuclease P protein subunit p30 [Anopheles nili]